MIRVGYARLLNIGDRLLVAIHDQPQAAPIEATVERIEDRRIAVSLEPQTESAIGICLNVDGELVGTIGCSRTDEGLHELATFDNVHELVADTGRDPWIR